MELTQNSVFTHWPLCYIFAPRPVVLQATCLTSGPEDFMMMESLESRQLMSATYTIPSFNISTSKLTASGTGGTITVDAGTVTVTGSYSATFGGTTYTFNGGGLFRSLLPIKKRRHYNHLGVRGTPHM